MKKRLYLVFLTAAAVLLTSFMPRISLGMPSVGQDAPKFALKDLKDHPYDLSKLKDVPLLIVYFFDADSRPSQEGLLSLNQLAKQHKGSLTVWGVTRSPKEKAKRFVDASGLIIPVLLDASNVDSLYGARKILPSVAVIGPGLKIMDMFQGGGKTTEAMLVRLAERQLQRKQTMLARAISSEVTKKNPSDIKARAVRGYAALKDGNLKEAEEVFRDLSKGPKGEVLGKEGLAAVYAKSDRHDKALELADELEKKSPKRSYARVIKGDILYAQGKKKEAASEYEKASGAGEAEPYQEAARFNQLGRFYANSGQYKKARELYDQALTVDPFYIEGTTNKGITYEKEGNWDKALESYRQALSLEKSDTFAVVLAKKAQEMIDIQKDSERRKRMDQLVKDLAARFRAQKDAPHADADAWTSQPMVLTFVDFQEKGGLSERDGISAVMLAQLAEQLNSSGRVKVVERALMDRLLEELNLGSSELADPQTALKLGRVLAARLIGTGSLLHMPKGSLLSLRLIDTETSAIPQVTTAQLGASAEKEVFQLNREILKTVIEKYPLRGYVVKSSAGQVILNIGARQGVVAGTRFDLLEEPETITYKGKTLQSGAKPFGQLEVVRVEPDLCYSKIVRQDRPPKTDDKVQEKVAAGLH